MWKKCGYLVTGTAQETSGTAVAYMEKVWYPGNLVTGTGREPGGTERDGTGDEQDGRRDLGGEGCSTTPPSPAAVPAGLHNPILLFKCAYIL